MHDKCSQGSAKLLTSQVSSVRTASDVRRPGFLNRLIMRGLQQNMKSKIVTLKDLVLVSLKYSWFLDSRLWNANLGGEKSPRPLRCIRVSPLIFFLSFSKQYSTIDSAVLVKQKWQRSSQYHNLRRLGPMRPRASRPCCGADVLCWIHTGLDGPWWAYFLLLGKICSAVISRKVCPSLLLAGFLNPKNTLFSGLKSPSGWVLCLISPSNWSDLKSFHIAVELSQKLIEYLHSCFHGGAHPCNIASSPIPAMEIKPFDVHSFISFTSKKSLYFKCKQHPISQWVAHILNNFSFKMKNSACDVLKERKISQSPPSQKFDVTFGALMNSLSLIKKKFSLLIKRWN